ncbi:MAG: DUF2007 domain-containing protein [Acidobacteria bacterium]|nr:DUF2007 domain-containing protein [Acidobacteriota bacterium]
MENAEGIWAGRSDVELLEAAERFSEYTEEGERGIRVELARRGLAQPEPPIGACSRCNRAIARGHSLDRCSRCGEPFPPDILHVLGAPDGGAPVEPEVMLESVLRTADAGLIAVAKSLLEGEGIEYLVRGDRLPDLFGAGRLGGFNILTGPAEFLVHPRDAERARALLDGTDAPPPEPDPEEDA